MTHGTVPWEGAGERRTLFYKCAVRSLGLWLSALASRSPPPSPSPPPFQVLALYSSTHAAALTGRAGNGGRYVPFGMHHGDRGYDVHDPELTDQQRSIVEFPESW